MQRIAVLVVILLASAFASVLQAADSPKAQPARTEHGLRAMRLQVNAATDPMGVDEDHPTLRWRLEAMTHGDVQEETAYQVVVSAGPESGGDIWDSGKVPSGGALHATYSGPGLLPDTTYYWAVRVWDKNDRPSEWSATAHWTTGLRPEDWKAKWIAASPDTPQQRPALETTKPTLEQGAPLPIFRHEFAIAKPVKEAHLYVCGLGQYELRVNGKPATDAVLTPGWTDYAKTVPYNSYDITGLLREGGNAFAVLLGNGMYNVEGVKGRYTKFVGSFGQPKLIVELRVRFADGGETSIVSDRSWKTHPGPITFSSTYGGEDYDAQLEQAGWELPNFNEKAWKDALEVDGPGGVLRADRSAPIKGFERYSARRLTDPKPGVQVYDLGQNFAGWPLLRVRGAAGEKVTVTAGELLDPDGYVSQKSANARANNPNLFSYTLSGKGEESWTPRFSYWGFRYVQVNGVTAKAESARGLPLLESLGGQAVHADSAVVGKFSSSDPRLGRIHDLIDRAILSNLVSVLTDCPHREKLGWLEQTHLAGSSIMYNYDVQRLYEKIAMDMQDSQLASGLVPEIAPEYVAFVDKNGVNTEFRDSPEWGSASILSPWTAYQFYGDKRILERSYQAMQRYAAYLRSKAKDHILSFGLGDWYDIGPKAPGVSQLTGKGLTATATYYQDLAVLTSIAHLLGKAEDARTYAAESELVKAAFNASLFHPGTDVYDHGSQTASAMPLVLGLVPESHRKAVLENLVKDIRSRGNHVTAGDIGFHYVVRALTDGGRSDVLYDMLSRTDSPSYGYQLTKGATTLTEAWDTNPDSSQNHFMLGHAEEWFYRGLAGIRVDMSKESPQQIVIEPAFVGRLASASASFDSVLGTVESGWNRVNGGVDLEVTIPVGAKATVLVPARKLSAVSVQGVAVSKYPMVEDAVLFDGYVKCVLGSGSYRFRVRE